MTDRRCGRPAGSAWRARSSPSSACRSPDSGLAGDLVAWATRRQADRIVTMASAESPGRWLRALTLAHVGVGIAVYRRELRGIAADGFFGAVPYRSERAAALWFIGSAFPGLARRPPRRHRRDGGRSALGPARRAARFERRPRRRDLDAEVAAVGVGDRLRAHRARLAPGRGAGHRAGSLSWGPTARSSSSTGNASWSRCE